MAALDPTKSRAMEHVAAFVIVAFTLMEAFLTVAPYLGWVAAESATLAQQQTLVQTVMVAIVSFLFGASVGTQSKDKAVEQLAATNAKQTEALTPSAPTIPVSPGDTVSVTGVDSPKT